MQVARAYVPPKLPPRGSFPRTPREHDHGYIQGRTARDWLRMGPSREEIIEHLNSLIASVGSAHRWDAGKTNRLRFAVALWEETGALVNWLPVYEALERDGIIGVPEHAKAMANLFVGAAQLAQGMHDAFVPSAEVIEAGTRAVGQAAAAAVERAEVGARVLVGMVEAVNEQVMERPLASAAMVAQAGANRVVEEVKQGAENAAHFVDQAVRDLGDAIDEYGPAAVRAMADAAQRVLSGLDTAVTYSLVGLGSVATMYGLVRGSGLWSVLGGTLGLWGAWRWWRR